MSPAPLVTLTTDFGTRDAYVAAMKGVILSRCPSARVTDLSHDIPPQDVREAAFFLAGAVPWFPRGTVHVVVVDPGVGTARRPVAAALGGQTVVCPDNGLLTLLLRDMPLEAAHELTGPRFTAACVSATFHGRDVFAPAAARLASGVPLCEAGPPVDELEQFHFPEPTSRGGVVRGEVTHIDRFGNLITNIDSRLLEGQRAESVEIGRHRVEGILPTYGVAEKGCLLALFGSRGYLEVAVNEGSAADWLGAERGTPAAVTLA